MLARWGGRRRGWRLTGLAEEVGVKQPPRLLSRLADAVGSAPRLLSRQAERARIRRAVGLLSGLTRGLTQGLTERVGRARRELGLVSGWVVNELPLVVLGTLAINLDTRPVEGAGDTRDADRRCVLHATSGRLIGTKELIVDGIDGRIRSVPCGGRLGLRLRLLRLKQASRPGSEDLAAAGWILRGRIRERLETAGTRRLPWSAGRERRIVRFG